MNSFGFENFKRFKNIEAINLSNINFLVGANNSGKSTFIKALLLAVQNLKAVKNVNTEIRQSLIELPLFRLDLEGISNPRVGTFNRAITHDIDEDDIIFQFSSIPYSFAFSISREANGIDYSESPVAPITEVEIYAADFDMRFHFYLDEKISEIEFFADSRGINKPYFQRAILDLKEELLKALENLKELKEKYKDDDIVSTGEIRSIEERIRKHEDILGLEIKEYAKIVVSFGECNDGSIVNLLKHLLNSTLSSIQGKPHEESENLEYLMHDDKKFLFFWVSALNKISEDVSYILENKKVEYIYAHTAKRATIYDINDRNDYTADTIHNYVLSGIKKPSDESEFVMRWMKEFGIGDDYEIESEAGELYKVYIIDKKSDKEYKTLLSDKGTGTIHLMELLLKLATLYRKYKGNSLAPTIVIEEPEQNLHPKAQSLLTDMLAEIVEMSRRANAYTNGFQFIVETHSEYMIRQSQVRVKGLMEACKDIETTEEANTRFEQEIPFKTYYFPSEGEPYEMIYRKDGNFSNEFGKGFFDEANNLLFEII